MKGVYQSACLHLICGMHREMSYLLREVSPENRVVSSYYKNSLFFAI